MQALLSRQKDGFAITRAEYILLPASSALLEGVEKHEIFKATWLLEFFMVHHPIRNLLF